MGKNETNIESEKKTISWFNWSRFVSKNKRFRLIYEFDEPACEQQNY